MIPAEAFEKVALMLFNAFETAVSWEQSKDAYDGMAREVIEAAAPFMHRDGALTLTDTEFSDAILAAAQEAWDECANQPSRPRLEDNPYRNAGVIPGEEALYPDGSLVEFDHHRPTL